MSTLMSRGAVLTFSRLSNFGVLLISPLLLVRILEVEAYGQYQEFMIYASLLVTVCGFTVDSSLTYFLPKYETAERALVSQASALILGFSTLCLSVLYLARSYLVGITSYDFVVPLIAYVFCFVNLNWLEYYWIAKRRTDLVLYYSGARVVVRMTILLLVAYLTRDVPSILWSMVAVEACRIAVVASLMLRYRMFTVHWHLSAVAEQLKFSGPLGVSVVVQQTGRNIGKLFVGSVLGPVALAYYAVGSYLIPGEMPFHALGPVLMLILAWYIPGPALLVSGITSAAT
jgi:O-antigen/teichoic acid export membrane protein